jgi:hypothetical protein
VPGTDTTIGITATDLGGQTYAAWADAFHADQLTHVQAGCDGGKPSGWAKITIGGTQGYLVRKCNEVVAIAPVGERVYEFAWGNQTFNETTHYPEQQFETLLSGVTFPDAATANKPLWNSSSPTASSAS